MIPSNASRPPTTMVIHNHATSSEDINKRRKSPDNPTIVTKDVKRPRTDETTEYSTEYFESLLKRLEKTKEPSKKQDEKESGSDDDLNQDNDDEEEDKEVEWDTIGGGKFWVYVLESCASPHYSYIGFTVDRERRLRQHNGDLKCGGAKYTKTHRPWRMVMSMSVDDANTQNWWTKSAALQLEWRSKHVCKSRRTRRRPPSNSRWRTLRVQNRPAVERRINDIFWLLNNRKKWTRNSPEWQDGRSLRIEMHPSLITPQIQEFAKNCAFWKPTIHPFSPDLHSKSIEKNPTISYNI